MTQNPYQKVENLQSLPAPDSNGKIQHYVFQYIDFKLAPQYVAARHNFSDCCFMGCTIPSEMEGELDQTCIVFPRMGMIYQTFASRLYSGDTLYAGFDPSDDSSLEKCFDSRVYSDYLEKGKDCNNLKETLARSLHDRAISDAMNAFLGRFDEKQVVAVMGGHTLSRTDEAFRNIALISKSLTEYGKIMASGGGPGAMEATHFGAWMAGRSLREFDEALELLKPSPTFHDKGWLKTAFEVREKFPQSTFRSLGIPTWFYGHEPSTPFATDIAKYFMNSLREAILLAVAKGGIIYSPGSAGTLQEIFQDAAQNHYETLGYSSPMVFFGTEYFTKEVPVYPLLEDLLERDKYKGLLLSITDSRDDVINTILSFSETEPPRII